MYKKSHNAYFLQNVSAKQLKKIIWIGFVSGATINLIQICQEKSKKYNVRLREF